MSDFTNIDINFDITNPFRAMGLIVPDDEPSLDLFAACGCRMNHDMELHANDELMKFLSLLQHQGIKVETPSTIELQLASRMHRWNDMQRLQKDFYKSLEDKVWEYERDALKLFGLPTIDNLQRDAEGDAKVVAEFDINSKAFELTPVKRRAYTRVIKEWMLDVIGRDEILTDKQIADLEEQKSFYMSFADAVKLDVADSAIAKQLRFMSSITMMGKQPIGAEIMPIYDFNMLSGFSIGQKNTWKQILDNYRATLRQQGLNDDQIEARVRELLRTQIIPQASNRHLAYFMNSGKNRIQAQISSKIYAGVLKVLQQMAREGRSPLEVGRYLHGMYGGQLWQWLRIARSEPVLAYNAAFDEQSRAAGVQYEEWNAASGCCDICAAFDGRVWRLGEGPQPCTLSNCQIMTVDGWKQIKDIKLGELVLTHTGKFKQVTKLYRHKEPLQRMVKVHYKNIPYAAKRKGEQSVLLEITDNHPVYIEGNWIAAGNLKAGDKIRLLATRCPVCNKLQPYSRWRNVHGDKANFCSLDCSNVLMDNWVHRPKEETIAIRKKISDFKKENNPMHDKFVVEKMTKSKIKSYKENPEIRKQMSESRLRFHNENPDFTKEMIRRWREENPEHYELVKKNRGKSLSKYYQDRPGLSSQIQKQWQVDNPERFNEIKKVVSLRNKKRLKEKGNILLEGFINWKKNNPDEYKKALKKSAKTLAANKWISRPQKKMYELIKQFYPDAELNLPIETNIGVRFGDIVLPNKRIILEYDGQHWHQDKDKDLQRDLELQFAGWTVLHFDKDTWQKAPKQVERLLKNHNNEYEFLDIKIDKIEKTYRTNVELFNLEVAEDESYIAKGIIVHNCADTHPHCLCIRLARFMMPVDKPLQQNWSRVSPYEQGYKPDEIAALADFLRNNTIGIPRPGLI